MQALSQKVLIAEDDKVTRHTLSRILQKEGFEVVECSDGEKALALADDSFSLVVLDIHMPKLSGLDVLKTSQKQGIDVPFVMISGAGTKEAVKAMSAGAFWYIQKPIAKAEVLAVIGKALEHSKVRERSKALESLATSANHLPDIVGEASSSIRLLKQAEVIASQDSTVLLTGESGTGKSTFARFIHHSSSRKDAPFVSVSCAAIPRDLLEAELFGYEKGAFTGATSMRLGKVEMAEGGTLFLDEIGDLPLELQPKLLTFLEERSFTRLGSNTPKSVNVRIIAATLKDLEKMCDEKRFRLDLFYRLSVIPLKVPSLRERTDDIPKLVEKALRRIQDRSGHEQIEVADDVMQQLIEYPWPGNVRELENVLESAVAFCEDATITLRDLQLRGVGEELLKDSLPLENRPARLEVPVVSFQDKVKTLAEIERQAVMEALERNSWNRCKTARELGISEKGLYNKIKRFSLCPTQ